MDWMRRREELGETLDETKDPRILPTLSSHNKLTSTLHHLLLNCKNNSNFEYLVNLFAENVSVFMFFGNT
jgi:hypothetical protein